MEYSRFDGTVSGIQVSWSEIAIKWLHQFADEKKIPYPIIKNLSEVHAVNLAVRKEKYPYRKFP